MKDFENHKGRLRNDLLSMTDTLFVKRVIISLILFNLLVIYSSLLVSCYGEAIPTQYDPGEPKADSLDFMVEVIADSIYKNIECLDLLIYEAVGVEMLESHLRLKDPTRNITLQSIPGRKKIVIIANSKKPLGIAALQRFESARLLEFDYSDDSPSAPVMGGIVEFNLRTGSDKDTANNIAQIGAPLSPIMSRVIVRTISNNLDDYELLESPRIRLRNINSSALLFNQDKQVRPSGTIDAGEWLALDYDIGFYPQEVNAILYCYPHNDLFYPEKTTVEFECRIKGEICSFDIEVPNIAYHSTTYIDICVDSPEEISAEII